MTNVRLEFFDKTDLEFPSEIQEKKRLDKKALEWQKNIKPGDFFKKPTEFRIDIYGEVLGIVEGEGFQNYRRCKCYSSLCPDGEEGTIHVANINMLISKYTFDSAVKGIKEKNKKSIY